MEKTKEVEMMVRQNPKPLIIVKKPQFI